MIDVDGDPIDGLYVAGNVMASAMALTYGGAGGTLGPGMVFGYLAGRHVAARPRRLTAAKEIALASSQARFTTPSRHSYHLSHRIVEAAMGK